MSTETTIEQVGDEVLDAAPPGGEVKTLNPLEKIAAGLDALSAEAKAVDLTPAVLATVAGDKAARAFRLRCVKLRTSADEAYESVNHPLLTKQRNARTLLADIKRAIESFEVPADKAIVAVEEAKKAAALAKAEAERQRIADIRARIESIAAVARRAVGKPAADIEAKIKIVVGIAVDDSFGELKPEAERAHAETLASLREMLAAALVQEAEAARLAAERERLERLELLGIRLHNLRSIDPMLAGRTANAIQAHYDGMAPPDAEEWGEFLAAAEEAYEFASDGVRSMILAARERERIAAEQATEAARLSREREAHEAQKRADREQQERIDAQAAADRKAADDQARVERVEADRQADELRRADQQRLDADRAKLAAEQAEVSRVAKAQDLRQLVDTASHAAVRRGIPPGVVFETVARFHDGHGVLSAEVDDCIAALNALQPETEPPAGETNEPVPETEGAIPETGTAADETILSAEEARDIATEATGLAVKLDIDLAECRAALTEALELLEGWIAYKCVKKHQAEHYAKVAELRQRGGLAEGGAM